MQKGFVNTLGISNKVVILKSIKSTAWNAMLDCPLMTVSSFLQQGFLLLLALISFFNSQQDLVLENTATSTKVSPQKCFSKAIEMVEHSTKSDSVIEINLCKNEYFTMQN